LITKGRIPDFIATIGTLEAFRGVALIEPGGLPVPSHLTATELRGYLPEPMITLDRGNVFGLPIATLTALGAPCLPCSSCVIPLWDEVFLPSAEIVKRRACPASM
jgi:ribose/xylose/arabinose/galactoside ABC-type transport system permease subunit